MHEHDRARIIALTIRVLNGPQQADEWLDRPNVQLGGRPPREMMGSDVGLRRVEELLTQLDYDSRSYTP